MTIEQFLTVALAAGACVSASAQGVFPERPIRMVVPYNAGGAGDVMARAIGRSISEKLGQTVVVDNKPGASGMIGTSAVANAKGDPYTLLMGSSAEISINPGLYKKISYRPEMDLKPVAFAGKLPLVLLAAPASGFNSFKDALDGAKRKPGAVTFASAGAGQTAHLAMEVIMQKTATKMLHVPYKGGSEAVMAVASGQAYLFFSGLPPALTQIKAEKLRALAISTKERATQLPNVPTVAESGVAGFDIFNWFAVFVPAAVSTEVVEKLNKAINEALDSPEVKGIWAAQGIVAQKMQPAELGAFVASETLKYKALIAATHITLD